MSEWAANFSDKCFIREDRYKLLLSGIGVTIKVSLLAIVIGILIGMLIAMCNLSKKKLLRFIGGVYTDVIRGTPSVTQLMIIYFVILPRCRLISGSLRRSRSASIPVRMCPRSSGQAFFLLIRGRRKREGRLDSPRFRR